MLSSSVLQNLSSLDGKQVPISGTDPELLEGGGANHKPGAPAL